MFGGIFSHLQEILLLLTQHFSGLIILLLVVVVVAVHLHLVMEVVEAEQEVLYLPFILPQQLQLRFQKHILGTPDILCKLENNILLVLDLMQSILEQEVREDLVLKEVMGVLQQ